MKLSTFFKISAVTAALALAGCGGDINVTPTVNDGGSGGNGGNGGNNGGDNGGSDNPCASYDDLQGSYDGQDCSYNATFASKNVEIEQDLTFAELPDGGVHIFDGALQIGRDCNTTTGCEINQDGPVMTVEPGATLAFTSGEAIIQVARGAKLVAEGTFDKPIKFTSANEFARFDVAGNGPRFSDWGGIIINGNGITNQCTDAQRDAGTCNVESEGIVSYYGGNDNADDSGSMRYAQIWYAGSGPRDGGDGDDLNSLTLNAVGSGSSYEYLHIHQGYDDGIEFFGGAANVKHIVFTDNQDDSMDIDAGWQGKAQFLFIKHGTVNVDGQDVFMGNGGFEADGEKNSGAEYAGAPASAPRIANVTIITTDGESTRDGDPSIATKFDDNFQGKLYNFLEVKTAGRANDGCILFTNDGELGVDNGELEFYNSVMACVNEFVDNDGNTFADGESYAQWFDNGGANIRIGGNATVLNDDGISTDMSSADITITANDLSSLNDDFFDSVDFIGALSNSDTSSEWYQWVQTAVAFADQD
ncbi:hypothetical protein [Idiomarina xiamenensis]|uniref:Lipoprotein n=1 Tax=Idiomarina xiamenensis 10-D-4 TaxID=740709 RepID=K2KAX1_9GAMM|nr:hypothetical protein [Idiomarina xiamenensis]EKE83672.1 hypothetical protein A10D4_07485 [Idiomarina xiamenensis 10-D-4]